jgi:hypothetical protein
VDILQGSQSPKKAELENFIGARQLSPIPQADRKFRASEIKP